MVKILSREGNQRQENERSPDNQNSYLAQSTGSGEIELAASVQASLLPKANCCLAGWEIAFSYEPAFGISGDYIDIVEAGPNAFHFLLGDVSGKGVAAALLMAGLHATIRVLLSSGITLEEVVRRASSRFCDGSLPAQFATLVLGTATMSGDIQIFNCGHTPAFFLHNKALERIPATGVPLGLFCEVEPASASPALLKAVAGDQLFLYSDGVTEAAAEDGSEYGMDRLHSVLLRNQTASASEAIGAVVDDLRAFTGSDTLADDRSLLSLRFLQEFPLERSTDHSGVAVRGLA